jgi:uncharacterized protein YegP (UPF0339 family)
MYFTVGNTKGGEPSWWLYGDNHEMVAWAGETFDSQSGARRACEGFKAGAATARYEAYVDGGGDWRWRASRSSDKVAASGESFDGRYEAERAGQNVRRNAGDASGP